MVISEKRSNAKKDIKLEFMMPRHVQCRIGNEVVRLISSGHSCEQAICQLADDIVSGRFNISSSSSSSTSQTGASRMPSINVMRRAVQAIHSEYVSIQSEQTASRPPISPMSPYVGGTRPRRPVNLGNAVRNLGAAFSGEASHTERSDQTPPRPWRTASINSLRSLMDTLEERRRIIVEGRNRALRNVPSNRDPNIPPFQYNPELFSPKDLTLSQAISVMDTFDFEENYYDIRATLLKFSIKIYGLEDCPRQDLRIAVFLFLERYFNIQPVIELCIRPVEDYRDRNVIGVLFQNIPTVNHILGNKYLLSNTPYKVSRNSSASWIIWNYDG